MKNINCRLKLYFKCYHHIWKLKGPRIRLGYHSSNVLLLHWIRNPESFFQKVTSEVRTWVTFCHVLYNPLQWKLAWIRSQSWEQSSVNIIHLNTTANFLLLSEDMGLNLLKDLFWPILVGLCSTFSCTCFKEWIPVGVRISDLP